MLQRFLPNQKILFLATSILLLGGIVFFLQQAQVKSASTPSDIAGRDAKRISDLNQIQSALTIYFNKCGYYPGSVNPAALCAVPPTILTCATAGNTCFVPGGVVYNAIMNSKLGIASVPNDPNSNANYLYGTNDADTGYVLGATLEDPTNLSLTQSVHGAVDGLNCSDSVYCVQVSK